MKNVTILCPVPKQYKDAPDHLLYGSKSFDKVARKKYGVNVTVRYLYVNGDGGFFLIVKDAFMLLWTALTKRHDVVYYCTDPKCFLLLSFMKLFKIYNKPMYAWKYIAIHKSINPISNLVKKVLYGGFDKIFMMTENHVPESIQSGLVTEKQVVYLKWGEDLSFVNTLKVSKESIFTFISTGKAYRDFETLLKAFDKVENARLILYLPTGWGNFNYVHEFKEKIINPNVKVIVVGGKNQRSLKEIFLDMKRSHCSLCICHPVNFGVGYTQVLDSMACGLPVILTDNKDNPIDVNKTKTGITVPPGDINSLANAMNRMVKDDRLSVKYGQNAYHLVETEYNIEIVSEKVLAFMKVNKNIFCDNDRKKH